MSAILPLYIVLKYFFIFFDALLVFVAVFAIAETLGYRPHLVFDPRRPTKKTALHGHGAHFEPSVEEQWRKISARLADESHDSLRLAVIEADGFVDSMLKRKGYSGDTFADRLSQLDKDSFETLDLAWNSHRLRNDLVHTPNFKITAEQARKALVNYEAFLRELGVLAAIPSEETQHLL